MSRYPNGEIPREALDPIPAANGQTAWLLPLAAASFLRVAALAKTLYGFDLMATSAGDGFRSYLRQVNVFLERYEEQATGSGRYGDVRWWQGRRYVRMRGAAAAIPGTSNHGKGITVDITGLGGFNGFWFVRIAPLLIAEGWSNLEGSRIREYWHWNYTRTAEEVDDTNHIPDVDINLPPDLDIPEPITPITEEDDMTTRISNGGGHYLVNHGTGLFWGIPDVETDGALTRAYDDLPVTAVDDRTFLVLRQAAAATFERLHPGFRATFLPDRSVGYAPIK